MRPKMVLHKAGAIRKAIPVSACDVVRCYVLVMDVVCLLTKSTNRIRQLLLGKSFCQSEIR